MYHKVSALLRFGRYVENITSITDVHLNYCAGSGPSTRCSSQVLTRDKRWPPVEWLNGADTLPLSLDKTITPMFEFQLSQDLHVSELCKYLGRCIKCVLTLRLVWDHQVQVLPCVRICPDKLPRTAPCHVSCHWSFKRRSTRRFVITEKALYNTLLRHFTMLHK